MISTCRDRFPRSFPIVPRSSRLLTAVESLDHPYSNIGARLGGMWFALFSVRYTSAAGGRLDRVAFWVSARVSFCYANAAARPSRADAGRRAWRGPKPAQTRLDTNEDPLHYMSGDSEPDSVSDFGRVTQAA